MAKPRLALFPILLAFLSACAVRGVLLNPPPLPLSHQDSGYSLGAGLPLLNGEFQKRIGKTWDTGVLLGGYRTREEEHYNLSGFLRKWVTLPGKENPFFHFYLAPQGSWNRADIPYRTAHLELGIAPGFYRERFDLAFVLRGGGGWASPYEQGGPLGLSYVYLGPGLQLLAFPLQGFGLGLEGNFTLGAGGMRGALIAVVPAFLRLFVVYRSWE